MINTEYPLKYTSGSACNSTSVDSVIKIGDQIRHVTKVNIYTPCSDVILVGYECYNKEPNRSWMWIDKELHIPVQTVYNHHSDREVIETMDSLVFMTKQKQKRELKKIILNCPPDTKKSNKWKSWRINK